MQSPLPLIPFYFLRHGQTDWNAIKRIHGITDIPLNANGLAQAQTAASLLKGLPIGTMISSPLQRAAATAAIVQEHLGAPLTHDAALKEQFYGSFEGRIRTELAEEFGPEALHDFSKFLPADAEATDAFKARVLSTMAHHLGQAPAHPALFVGHGGFMSCLAYALNIPSPGRFANATPYHFYPTTQGWAMEPLLPPTQNTQKG